MPARPADELRRLREGPRENEPLEGIGSVRFVAQCEHNAEIVLRNTRQVLETVVLYADEPWCSDAEWAELIPDWFVQRCSPRDEDPELSLQEQRRRRELPYETQYELRRTDEWPFSNWIYWFRPEMRCWWWWDAIDLDPNTVLVAVVVDEWPFTWGALDWTLRASGALRVDPEK